jgi:hypothetical protein
MDEEVPAYSHKQESLLCLLIYGTAIALLVGASFTHDRVPIALILGGGGVLTVFLGMAFHHLTVEDQGEFLAIHFGPLPLFHRTVQYADIVKVEAGRTRILDGWGIHYSFRRGWVWNVWGRSCVVVHLKKSVLRIGTDDAENLARFLDRKSGGRAAWRIDDKPICNGRIDTDMLGLQFSVSAGRSRYSAFSILNHHFQSDSGEQQQEARHFTPLRAAGSFFLSNANEKCLFPSVFLLVSLVERLVLSAQQRGPEYSAVLPLFLNLKTTGSPGCREAAVSGWHSHAKSGKRWLSP